ncbi:MAG: phosphoribosylformylglycinamidine synthase [Armatimonadetes bacterium CG_4_9_14_3_um_filter_66_14]|nr:MAG: phosphoribosylformylglycinamidine synthase [Armatimonadetes bacterium CG_4_9_14_3_um_filter_66_14]
MPSDTGEVRALVITGYGLNCEAETSYGLRLAGARPEQVHLSELLTGNRSLDEFHLLAFIGGFSFGDHLAAGTAFANRVRRRLGDSLQRFVKDGKLVIAICNGFQTVVKLGLLPGLGGDYQTRLVTLTNNDCGTFQDRWVRLRFNPASPCVFTQGLAPMDLPIRHGEGKFVALNDEVLDAVRSQHLVAAQYVAPDTGEPTQEYPHNPNGSADAIAGICDPTGRIFGLMPHPEAYLSPLNHPHWGRQKLAGCLPEKGAGTALFENAVRFAGTHLAS